MTQENKQILIKRFKSFIWRIGGLGVVTLLNFIAENIGLFDLPVWAIGIIGLVVGEITKYLNKGVKESINNT